MHIYTHLYEHTEIYKYIIILTDEHIYTYIMIKHTHTHTHT